MDGWNFLKTLFTEFLGPTVLGGGATWLIFGAVFRVWKSKWGDPNDLTKILLWAAPLVAVVAVYFGGVYVEAWTYDKATLLDALGKTAEALVGARVARGATEKVKSA